VRARDIGIEIGDLEPGPLNAITDVEGVRVGHTTLIEGDDVRTGVTVVVPAELPVFAAPFRLNGNGEVTGLQWMRESGLLTTPIALTNTHSVGAVHEALVAAAVKGARSMWSLPVVAETWDGVLNDVNGFHVRPEHARAALDSAADGPVPEGHVVGVLVQSNHGTRARLAINGVPVGRSIGPDRVPLPPRPVPGEGVGSIVVVVATDAPLLPHQCEALALRAMLGVARTGGAGESSSGDFAIAFSTGSTQLIEPVPIEAMNPLYYAAIEATEEAIVNSMLAAETMTGRGGSIVHALDADLLAEAMGR
jgi:D-aminopeptidase